MPKIVFCHDFLLNEAFFQELGRSLSDKYQIFHMNVGYFGKSILPLKEFAGAVAIGHGLGFSKLLELNYNFKAMIGIGAFLKFSNGIQQTRHLQNLSMALDLNAQTAIKGHVARYLNNNSYPLGFHTMNLKLIKADLQTLERLDIVLDFSKLQVPSLFLHGAKDLLISINQATEQLQNYNLKVHPNSDHSLGYGQVLWCAKEITEFLNLHNF